ncbi:unnamed protein product [Paramecium sonneborni]|uniref:Uncharacterized protein n=1 Tax=Paramecium sonneborni TaxID=65129 RepID=A0A8S1K792_9CILI|nr:unnamed protein product [Paramecium sonneborni]
MSVYIHKAFISKNECIGDHNYFYHEGQNKQEQSKLNQKNQDENTQIDKLHHNIQKQQQMINQLESQNSNYNQIIIKQEQQIQQLLNQLKQQENYQETQLKELIDENQKLKIIIKENQIHSQNINFLEYQEVIVQTEEKNETIFLDKSQQIEIAVQNKQIQTDIIMNDTSKEAKKNTQPLKLDVKTIKIQPIYYYQS